MWEELLCVGDDLKLHSCKLRVPVMLRSREVARFEMAPALKLKVHNVNWKQRLAGTVTW